MEEQNKPWQEERDRPFAGYIGMFDSGVGGVSVLSAAMRALPHERFLFFGDSANNPYGEKSPEWISARAESIVNRMLDDGVKAVVIACNTATSAAADHLRSRWPDVPIVGTEPALKPAACAQTGDILVMATAATLALPKFRALYRAWGADREVHAVACVGLADRIERGDLDAPDVTALIESLIGEYRGRVDNVVLGCTHYPFVCRQIRAVLGDVRLFDGADGTVRQLAHLLDERHACAGSDQKGGVVFRSSKDTPGELELYRRFLTLPTDC